MAHNRVGFNQLLKKAPTEIGLLLDTNILIAYFFEDHRQHEIVRDFVERLEELSEVSYYSTITIKSEFLEFRRRQYLTEGLLELVDTVNKGNGISVSAKSKIDSIKARLSGRKRRDLQKNEEGLDVEDQNLPELFPSDRFFVDREIKEIKHSFRAKNHQNERGWLKICEKYLNKLKLDEDAIDSFCVYLPQKDEKERESIFSQKKIEWKDATHLCSYTGMGYSDAMIFNVFKVSNLIHIVTLDDDLVYATTVNAPGKKVLIPDGRIKKLKKVLRRVESDDSLPSGNN